MKVDAKKILARRAQAKARERAKVSLYLSKDLYARFKKACAAQGTSASLIMEDLMRAVVEADLRKLR